MSATATLPVAIAEPASDATSARATLQSALPQSVAANRWAAEPLAFRLQILGRARALIATRAELFADAIDSSLERSRADTLAAEVLPLLAALRYLETDAPTLLAARHLGVSGRPVWLGRVTSQVERVPLGRVLIIGVSNYPLFLPGVQVVQALAAGNTVVWKPGRHGGNSARLMAQILVEAGLPMGLLTVTDETTAAAQTAIASGVDKIFFTGSAAAGRAVLRLAAETVTPCVLELSGADAVIVLPSAPIAATVRAIVFGLRLNGSATCMAPRRLLLVDASPDRRLAFLHALWEAMQAIGPVAVSQTQATLVEDLLAAAQSEGATVFGGEIESDGRLRPALIVDASASMQITQTDLFAPVLSVLDVHGTDGVLRAQAACPLALTASIFGQETEARALAARLTVGHVSINDLIVPTADPRVPFVARKQSGFGATRGAEGLLEMTTPRAIAVRRGSSTRRYETAGAAHFGLFAGLAALVYGGSVLVRLRGAGRMLAAAQHVSQKSTTNEQGDR